MTPAIVPDGTAYLAANDVTAPLELVFSEDIFQAGAFVTGQMNPIALSAYNASGNLLDQVTIGTVNAANWNTNFLGLETGGGIRRITIGGAGGGGEGIVVDRLTFEPVGAIPEPGPLFFMALGAVFLAWQMTKRGKNGHQEG